MDTKNLMLELSHVSKSFGTQSVLNDLSLQMTEGTRLTILGPCGSGKTTLLKIISGLILPLEGKVSVFGQDPFALQRHQRQNFFKKLGIAFQQGALFDFMNVEDNILFALENMTDLPFEHRLPLVKRFLKSVNLSNVRQKFPSELSGGMRRRVGIVRALITSPKLALLDEPTAGLDPITSSVVINMIHDLAKDIGCSLVCLTSSVEVAFTFSQQVAILKEGSIVAQGTFKGLLAHRDPWLKHFLTVRGFVGSS